MVSRFHVLPQRRWDAESTAVRPRMSDMRYLVTARVKPGREQALAEAIEDGTLGAGSIAGGEYVRNMECARRLRDGSVKWVEVCYCATPLEEERPYWEEYFDLVKVQDAHARSRCKDLNGEDAVGLLRLRLHGQARSSASPRWGPLFLDIDSDQTRDSDNA